MEVAAGCITTIGLVIALFLCGTPMYMNAIVFLSVVSCVLLEPRHVNKDIMEGELGWKLRDGVSKGLYSVMLVPTAVILSTYSNHEHLEDDFSKMLLLMSIAAILAPLAVLSYTLLLTAQKTPASKAESGDVKKDDKQDEDQKEDKAPEPHTAASCPAPIVLEKSWATIVHVSHLATVVGVGLFMVFVSLNIVGFKASLLLVMHTLLLSIIQTTLPVLMPKSFSLGETVVCAQALTYFQLILAAQLWYRFEWLKIDSPLLASIRNITAFTEVALLSCLLVVVVLLFRPGCRTSTGFYLLLPSVMLVFSLPALYLVLNVDFVSWIARYIYRSTAKCYLFSYWAVATALSILAVYRNADNLHRLQEAAKPVYHLPAKIRNRIRSSQMNGSGAPPERRNSANEKAAAEYVKVKNDTATRTRKQFHLLTLGVFLPGLIADTEITCCAWSCALIVFIMLECMRIVDVYPFGSLLESHLSVFVDNRDQGPVILTPIYLLTGCTLPMWLYPKMGSHICLYSGVLSLGVGDTMASLVGSKYGKHKWPDSKKSVEGTLASIFAQLLFLVIFVQTGLAPAFQWEIVAIAITLTSLLEAFTSQIDNLIIPLLMYILTVS